MLQPHRENTHRMNDKTIKPTSLQIPDNLSTETAEALFLFLSDIVGALWATYERPLVERIIRQEEADANDRARELANREDIDEIFDDPIPF